MDGDEKKMSFSLHRIEAKILEALSAQSLSFSKLGEVVYGKKAWAGGTRFAGNFSHHLKKLSKYGFIEKKDKIYRITPRGQGILMVLTNPEKIEKFGKRMGLIKELKKDLRKLQELINKIIEELEMV